MLRKTCARCNKDKPLHCFGKQAKNPDGLNYRCKICDKKRYDGRCARIRENPVAYEEHRRKMREKRLMADFGMEEKDFQNMLSAQGGLCAVCNRPEKRMNRRGVRRLCVDHDHATGKVRALLCCDCNSAIGLFEENTDLLHAAIAYLQKYRVQGTGVFFQRKFKVMKGEVGAKIREWRVKRGISQSALAKKCGSTQAHICHLEQNQHHPSFVTLQKVADALQVPLAELEGQ